MGKRESQKQAKEMERLEAEKAKQEFLSTRLERLVSAMAKSKDLDINAYFYYGPDGSIRYNFTFPNESFPNDYSLRGKIEELQSYEMDSIDSDIADVEKERNRKNYLKNLKIEVLNRLSDDEKESLGF